MKKLLSVLFVFSLLMISVGPKPALALESIEIINVTYPSVVSPGQTFCFSVTVKVNDGQLLESRGDMLRNTDGNLFGHWPHIAVVGTFNAGQSYTFTCYGSGMTAPTSEGTYESRWRVWRNGGWVGPEAVIHFDVRNGGGGDSGGGGGGGGNFVLTCPPGAQGPSVKQALFHRSVAASEDQIIEYAASITISYCPSVVNIAVDTDSFELSSPAGAVTVDDQFNVTSSDLTVAKTNVHLVTGILTDNTDYPGMPYSGEAFTNTALAPISLAYYKVESQHELRNITSYHKPSYNYAFVPSVRTYAVQALANARFTLSRPAFSAFIATVSMWLAAVLSGALILAPYVPISYRIPKAHVAANISPATPEAITLFEQRYGKMVNWANLSGLTSERSVISAYTEFSVQGSGFTPNGQVYYQFGLPGEQPVIMDVAAADASGNVNFKITMPEPEQVPLGTYLLAAFDQHSIKTTLDEALDENLDPSKFFAAIVVIEVVQDVTPPTITILSPTATSYIRCDQPMLSFDVTDDLSGVAQVNAKLDQTPVQNGTKLDMLLWNLGTHSVDIQAFDKVGLEQNTHLEFQLKATINGTKCALNRFQEMKWFKINGTFVSINALLNSADRALVSHRPDIARNHFSAILNVLDAQKKLIDSRAYQILVMDLNALLNEPIP